MRLYDTRCNGDYTEAHEHALMQKQGCLSISGDLEIALTQLSDLRAFNSLTSVGGSLIIEGNQKLQSLEGLNSLTSVGGDLRIDGNFALESLDGLASLSYVGGNVLVGIFNYALMRNGARGSLNKLARSLNNAELLE